LESKRIATVVEGIYVSLCLLINRVIKIINDYRGISLLPTTHKILSSVIFSVSSPYLDEIIGNYQCGFGLLTRCYADPHLWPWLFWGV